MALSSSVTSSSGGLISQQLRLQQAQRNAEHAEVAARSLREKANEAQRNADHAQENASSLKIKSEQAQDKSGDARQRLVSLKSLDSLQSGFDALRGEIAAGLQTLSQPVTAPVAAPVVNAEGQTTGTVVNVTA